MPAAYCSQLLISPGNSPITALSLRPAGVLAACGRGPEAGLIWNIRECNEEAQGTDKCLQPRGIFPATAEWMGGVPGPQPLLPRAGPVLLCPAQGLCAHPLPSVCNRLESMYPGPIPRVHSAHWLRGLAGVAPSGHLGRKTPSLVPSSITTALYSPPAAIGAQGLCMAAPGQAGPKGLPALGLAFSTPPHFPLLIGPSP